MKKYLKLIFFFCFFWGIFVCCASAQSLVDDNNSLIDKNKSLVEKDKTLVDKSKTLVDKSKTLLDESKSLIKTEAGSVGAHSVVVSPTIVSSLDNVTEVIVENVEQDAFVNNYGAFLKAVTSIDPQARHKFVTYFSDWQYSGQEQDFFSYSANRAEQEKKIELCYDNAIKKFGVGTAIVATTWVVAIIVPGGTITYASVMIIAKATTVGAFSGAVFDGVVSGVKAAALGYSTEEIIYETINGAADGYLFGAIAGLAEGAIHVAVLTHNAKIVGKESYTFFDKKLYDKSGKLVTDLSKYSDDVVKEFLGYLGNGDYLERALDKIAVDYKKFNEFRLALENGEITSEEFWKLISKSGWPKDASERLLTADLDYGKYLKNLKGMPPAGMKKPHAHHILFKTGNGPKQQALVKEGQEILRGYGIDPIAGPENLCWAPNGVVGQHSEEALQEIVEGLKMLKENGATREEIIEFLQQMGQKAALRG